MVGALALAIGGTSAAEPGRTLLQGSAPDGEAVAEGDQGDELDVTYYVDLEDVTYYVEEDADGEEALVALPFSSVFYDVAESSFDTYYLETTVLTSVELVSKEEKKGPGREAKEAPPPRSTAVRAPATSLGEGGRDDFPEAIATDIDFDRFAFSEIDEKGACFVDGVFTLPRPCGMTRLTLENHFGVQCAHTAHLNHIVGGF